MKTESRKWYVVYNTKTEKYLYFDEDGAAKWTPSVFGADKCNMTMHYIQYVRTHVVILRIKETIESAQ